VLVPGQKGPYQKGPYQKGPYQKGPLYRGTERPIFGYQKGPFISYLTGKVHK